MPSENSRYLPEIARRAEFVRRFVPSIDVTLALTSELRIIVNTKRNLGLIRPSVRRREAAVASTLAGYAGPDATIYDIGANVGLYSLVFAKGRTGKVISFEPYDVALTYLERSLALNNIRNVHVQQMVLSDYRGTIRFTPDTVTTAMSHVSLNGERGIDLPCWDLDSLIASRGLPPPALVKIDVEEHEMAILRGMSGTIDRHRPMVFVEGGTRSESGEIPVIAALKAMGYSIWNLARTEQLAPDTHEYHLLAIP